MVFTVGQALEAGKSEAWIRHAVQQNRLVRIRRGLYCDAELWLRSGNSALPRHVLEARTAWIALGRRAGQATTRPHCSAVSLCHMASSLDCTGSQPGWWWQMLPWPVVSRTRQNSNG